jgi:hypothetical protein
MNNRYSVGIVVTSILICFSAAIAFELSINSFMLNGGNSQRFIDLLPSLGAWSPSSKAFGNVSTGVVKRQSLTIANSGNTYAEDVTVAVTGAGFSLYSTQTFGNISTTLTAKVRFAPAVQGTYSGHLTYSAPNITAVSASLTGEGVSAITYLVNQNFEGTGYDNSESWTETIGTNGISDEDDTTATVLRDSQQLKLYAGDSGQLTRSRKGITANGSLYAHFLFSTTNVTPGTLQKFFALENSGQTGQLYISLQSDGKLRVTHGTGVAITAGALLANTKYHVWVRYVKAASGDGVYSVAFSTTTTEPTSGNNFAGGSNGSSTGDVAIVQLYASLQLTHYFDQILTANTAIPIGAL